ncbi:uncharacterized protein YALI1_A13236g [Yarrowia lipolytica]|uniref:Uncharacterized protein n=1 Tax=Yarrowia lipolytica TaxID=4952 RepID=A0A1D8N4P4_YARLL|nr:hypothetical protein YALI1_A13236g [Yarrowia lipolytica]
MECEDTRSYTEHSELLLAVQPHPSAEQPTFSRITRRKKLCFPTQSCILVWKMPYGIKRSTSVLRPSQRAFLVERRI